MPHTPERPAPSLCPTCRGDLAAQATEATLTYEVQGARFVVGKAKTRPKKKKKLSEEKRERLRAQDRAKTRAYIRLAAIYRPMYELLLAEEKLKEGLDPTLRSVPRTTPADPADLEEAVREAKERAERLGGDEP